MVCFSPLRVYRGRRYNPATGKKSVFFSPRNTFTDKDAFLIPCGRCEGCRLAKSYEWSLRCVAESKYHNESYFLTLTYDPDSLPSDRCLCRAHFQSFMKRLRWHFRNYKLRVFYCGEYGSDRHRPHYHAIIFGLPLSKENISLFPLNYSKRGNPNYYSPLLNEIWGKGLVTVGSCNDKTCAYVAQYTLKKLKDLSPLQRSVPPFVGCSNRPAIGLQYFLDFHKEILSRCCFQPDSSSHPFPIPRYYLKVAEREFPLLWFSKYELPRRLKNYRDWLMKKLDPEKYAELIDNKLKIRYYKERILFRRLRKRLDML